MVKAWTRRKKIGKTRIQPEQLSYVTILPLGGLRLQCLCLRLTKAPPSTNHQSGVYGKMVCDEGGLPGSDSLSLFPSIYAEQLQPLQLTQEEQSDTIAWTPEAACHHL